MTPQAGCPAAETPAQEDEHQMRRMMAKRSKIIKELIQTEKDYLNDLELCIKEVVQPLRNKQVQATLNPTPILNRIINFMESKHPRVSVAVPAGLRVGARALVPGSGFAVADRRHHQTDPSASAEGHPESVLLAKETVF